MRSRLSRPAVLSLAAVALAALSACSGGSATAPTAAPSSSASVSASVSPSVSASVSASAPASPAASPAASSADPALGQVVAITVAGGKVSGPSGRVKVKQGSVVTLRVTSDVADEVHLHGYDKHADVEKGGTADLTFTASLAGVFEAELEQRGLPLVELQVQ